MDKKEKDFFFQAAFVSDRLSDGSIPVTQIQKVLDNARLVYIILYYSFEPVSVYW